MELANIIISSITLWISLVLLLISLIPFLKKFIILLIIKEKSEIFNIYQLLSPNLFDSNIYDKKSLLPVEEKIWDKLNELIYNAFLSLNSVKLNIKEFNYQTNKDLFNLLMDEGLWKLLLLLKSFKLLKRKLKFIGKKISKTKILKIKKMNQYSFIEFNPELINKIKMNYFLIIPINYYDSLFYKPFGNGEIHQGNFEYEDFNIKEIYKEKKRIKNDYFNKVRSNKFSIKISFLIDREDCGCDIEHQKKLEFLLNFDKNKWMIEKSNKPHSNLNRKECIKRNEHLNKLKEILNS